MLFVQSVLDEYKFKIELHAHTSPVSRCSHITPEYMVDTCLLAGCDAVVITNHLGKFFMDGDAALRAAEYLDDYYKAKEIGKDRGLEVILGAEVSFTENFNDYLVYGIEPADIERIIHCLDKGIEGFYREFKNDRNLILQAHPFRKRMELAPLSSIDGIETFNCHPAHNSKVGLAARYARENSLIVSGGTDYHDDGDAGICLMRSKRMPHDSYDIAEILKSRDILFDISGSIVFPYGY